MPPPGLARRLFWLLACLAAGTLVALLGRALTADDRWFLAIPAALAVGWLFLADPSRCLTPGSEPNRTRKQG